MDHLHPLLVDRVGLRSLNEDRAVLLGRQVKNPVDFVLPGVGQLAGHFVEVMVAERVFEPPAVLDHNYERHSHGGTIRSEKRFRITVVAFEIRDHRIAGFVDPAKLRVDARNGCEKDC